MRLATYLSEKNIEPREFAGRIGVTAEAVRLYLAGERTPRRQIMQAIASATDGAVTANDFFLSEEA